MAMHQHYNYLFVNLVSSTQILLVQYLYSPLRNTLEGGLKGNFFKAAEVLQNHLLTTLFDLLLTVVSNDRILKMMITMVKLQNLTMLLH